MELFIVFLNIRIFNFRMNLWIEVDRGRVTVELIIFTNLKKSL